MVDFGNGTILVYNPLFRCFTDLLKLNNSKAEYNEIRFTENSAIIANLSKSVDKYIEKDTLTVKGLKK